VHNALIQALAKVDRPGDICTAGDLPLTMPGLEVEGLGLLRLPLAERQARKLIKCCQQAPYGKGSKTLVDTAVRRVWELDAKHVHFTNPKWETLIDSILEVLQQQLGLEEKKLSAQLYKLLVYEKGSFFLPHRDGEKLDRMVATLVVVLPSAHEGGELIVSHNGRQHEFGFGGAASGHELSYAAFYADCQHEVRPLESGYRLCLTYNVTLAKSRGRKGITAPSHDAVVQEIEALLNAWRPAADTRKLAVTFDHRYTRKGFTPNSLKGVDQSRAEVLFEAAERAGCIAHLALVTLWQHGTAESDYDEYVHGWNHPYHWNRDWDEDEEDEDEEEDYRESGSQYEMGEIFDTSLLADCWFDREGRKIRFGEIPVHESEVVSQSAWDADDPTEEEFEGYTGNAGMTLERWYHRAAVVIWPRTEHFAVLCGAGTDAAIAGLQSMVQRLKRSSKARREILRGECREFGAGIIDTWRADGERLYRATSETSDRNSFPGLLCELGDPELIRRFLAEVVAADGSIQLDPPFVKFCKQRGWSEFEAELLSVIEASTEETLVRNAELVHLICRQRDKNTERVALCNRLCESLAAAVQALDGRPSKDTWRVRQIDRVALLVSSVNAMLVIDTPAPLNSLIEHALDNRRLYQLTDTHLASIFALESRLGRLAKPNKAILHWLAACRQELERRTAMPPVEPQNYRRPSRLPCNCADCRQLSRFLADTQQREARFPLRKERRQHLHGIIDDNKCDLTHVTERRGRPYTLVCTKTNASFQRASQIYKRDTDNLSRIVNLYERLA
jgi:hypothetical protein